MEALIADGQVRARDERFATPPRHRAAPDPLHDKSGAAEPPRLLQPADFQYEATARTCVCPAGKSLYRKGAQLATKGYFADHFQGAQRDCGPCPLRAQCLRTPEKSKVRQVAFFTGRTAAKMDTQTARMQQRIDDPSNRAPATHSALPGWSRYLPTSGITRGSIGSPCAAARRSTGNGSCSVSCRTSRSSRITATRPKGVDGHGVAPSREDRVSTPPSALTRPAGVMSAQPSR